MPLSMKVYRRTDWRRIKYDYMISKTHLNFQLMWAKNHITMKVIHVKQLIKIISMLVLTCCLNSCKVVARGNSEHQTHTDCTIDCFKECESQKVLIAILNCNGCNIFISWCTIPISQSEIISKFYRTSSICQCYRSNIHLHIDAGLVIIVPVNIFTPLNRC